MGRKYERPQPTHSHESAKTQTTLVDLKRFAIQLVLLSVFAPLCASQSAPLGELKPFLQKHCYECHGAQKQKNDLRFDTLGDDLSQVETLRTWQDILDQLNLGEMPPEKQPQPGADEVAKVVDTLTAALKEAYAQHGRKGGRAVIRRLNRIELRNTLRDLLYLDGPVFRELGMAKLQDNIGDRLVMSDFLLKLIIGAAEESLKLATHVGEMPEVGPRTFAGHIRTQGPNAGLESWSRATHQDYDAIYERYREVVRCLAEKLLTYSSGRRLEPADRGEVDRIVAEVNKSGNKLRDLIHQVVRSDVFLTK